MSTIAAQNKVVVLVSGIGSNLKALINFAKESKSFAISKVISDNDQALALQVAKAHFIATKVVSPKIDSAQKLLSILDEVAPRLVLLAGYMSKIPIQVIQKYGDRILNIHPSLLPKYKGLNTHLRVLENNEKLHGASVHFVNENIDEGPCIAQSALVIKVGETPEKLKQKIHKLEHRLFPKVVELFLEGRVKLIGNSAYLDGNELKQPLIL